MVDAELKRPRAEILREPRGRPLFEAPLPGGRDLTVVLYVVYPNSIIRKTNLE